MAQAVIAAANRTTRGGPDPAYPVGKARLEAVAIILCAALMAMVGFYTGSVQYRLTLWSDSS